MMIFPVLLAMLVSSVQAEPFISGKRVKEGGFESSCRVKLTNTEPNGDYQFWICSGTLTKKNEVYTAAHCTNQIVKGKSKLEVSCGWIGSIPEEESQGSGRAGDEASKEKTRSGEVFLETHEVKEVYRFDKKLETSTRGDQARLILKKDSELKPTAPLPRGELSEFFTMPNGQDGPMLAKPGVSCEIQGFGEDNENRMGRLNRVAIDPNSLQKGALELLQITDMTPKGKAFQQSCVSLYQNSKTPDPNFPSPDWLHFINRWGFTGDRTRPGDSGGGLFCRKSPNEEYRLVGTCKGGLAYPKQLADGRWVMHDSVTWHPIETGNWQRLLSFP